MFRSHITHVYGHAEPRNGITVSAAQDFTLLRLTMLRYSTSSVQNQKREPAKASAAIPRVPTEPIRRYSHCMSPKRPLLVSELFPADDPVARMVLSCAMARNDINHALTRAKEAKASKAPELGYLVRLAISHQVEANDVVASYRQHSRRVQRFLKRLPKEAKAAKKASDRAVKDRRAKSTRNRTFHYPRPDKRHAIDFDTDLREHLQDHAKEPATVTVNSGIPNDWGIHLTFADEIALHLGMLGTGASTVDPEQIEQALAGAYGMRNYLNFIVVQYMERAGILDSNL